MVARGTLTSQLNLWASFAIVEDSISVSARAYRNPRICLIDSQAESLRARVHCHVAEDRNARISEEGGGPRIPPDCAITPSATLLHGSGRNPVASGTYEN